MRVLKNIGSQLHVYILWLLLSTVIWGYVFNQITDAPPEKKIVVFADAWQCREKALDIRMEQTKPASIRYVRVHTFDYVMFDQAALLAADIYLVPEERAADYIDSYLPLTGPLKGLEEAGIWSVDGTPYGILLEGEGAYFDFAPPGTETGRICLLFGKESLHSAFLTGRGDDAALWAAGELLGLSRQGDVDQ